MVDKNILTDELNDINQIFDKYYKFSTILSIHFINDADKNYLSITNQEFILSVKKLERKVQDLSEKINAENEFFKDNKFSLAINYSKGLLEHWIEKSSDESNRNSEGEILKFLFNNTQKLFNFLNSFYFNNATFLEIKVSFADKFGIHTNSKGGFIFKQIIEKESETIVLEREGKQYYSVVYPLPKKALDSENLKIEDGENVLYVGNLELWINTSNATEANKFMFLVSSILSNIENVELDIEESKVGSYFQKLSLKIKGWFAKEEIKQVLQKGIEATEAYTMDRHIEPIKKSQSERKKIDEEVDRMMPKEMTDEFHKIALENAKEDLESKKLANLEKKIAISNSLTEAFKNGLLSVDSDYRISLNGILLIEQNDKNITVNKDIERIDMGYRKELFKEISKPETKIEETGSDEEIIEVP